jgi:hypothetical protein
MFRSLRLLALALTVNCLLGAWAAAAAEWQVVRVTGLVWIVAEGMEPLRAAVGMNLPPNATVATTENARAMLRHDKDVLNVGPGTHIAPQARAVRGLTTVLMRQGEVEADIEHRAKPHFAVQTPFLAAVVKGTRFTVSVFGSSAQVAVKDGRVQVRTSGRRGSVDVTGGQTARLAGGALRVSGAGAGDEGTGSAEGPASSDAASAATTTQQSVAASESSRSSTVAVVTAVRAAEAEGATNTPAESTGEPAPSETESSGSGEPEGSGGESAGGNSGGGNPGHASGHNRHRGHGRGFWRGRGHAYGHLVGNRGSRNGHGGGGEGEGGEN